MMIMKAFTFLVEIITTHLFLKVNISSRPAIFFLLLRPLSPYTAVYIPGSCRLTAGWLAGRSPGQHHKKSQSLENLQDYTTKCQRLQKRIEKKLLEFFF